MKRRNFLSLLAASMALDHEKLLWTPEKNLISIPKPKTVVSTVTYGDVIYVWNKAHTRAYAWPLQGGNYAAGDTFTATMPTVFTVFCK